MTKGRHAPAPGLCALGLRPTDFDLVEHVDDRSLETGKEAASFATVTRCTKRWCGEATDEQTESD